MLKQTMIALTSAAAIGVGFAGSAEAASFSVQVDNVGSISFLRPNGPEAAAGFQLGENLRLNFTFSDAILDNDASVGGADYEDPNATLSLTGLTSGSTLSYFGGVELQIDDNEELEIEGLPIQASASNPVILDDDIDFDTQGTPFFSDVNDLSSVFADLFANAFPNSSGNVAETQFWDGNSSLISMRFGPVSSPATFTDLTAVDPKPVPEPASLLGLAAIGAVAMGGALKKRASA